MSTSITATAAGTGRNYNLAAWVLQVLGGAAFLAAGGAKLAAVPMMVAVFDQIGVGQWLRVVTGLVEVAGAVALLVPATASFGGVLLASTMAVAVLTHIFVIGGDPAPAFVLLLIAASVAWLRWASLLNLLGRS